MATTYNAGFPAYGTAAAHAASKTFQNNLKKEQEAEKTSGDKTAKETKSSQSAAATYEKSTAPAQAESYNKNGYSMDNVKTTVTGTPTGQVSGYARPGAVLNHQEYGKVVGEPKLSEEGAKYYDELKKKFKGLDFVLVGRDSVQAAKAQQNSYANGNRLVVLIDEDKIEQMAKDSKFRNYYEGIIKQAQAGQFAQAQTKATMAPRFNAGNSKKPNVLDNGAGGFLAASAKANKEFAKKISKIQEKKKAAKKADLKKAEKAAKEEKRKEKLEHKKETKREEREVRHDDIPREYREKFDAMARKIVRGEAPGEVTGENKDKEGAFVDFKA